MLCTFASTNTCMDGLAPPKKTQTSTELPLIHIQMRAGESKLLVVSRVRPMSEDEKKTDASEVACVVGQNVSSIFKSCCSKQMCRNLHLCGSSSRLHVFSAGILSTFPLVLPPPSSFPPSTHLPDGGSDGPKRQRERCAEASPVKGKEICV